MIHIPYSTTVDFSEDYLRDVCVNAIAEVFCDETGQDFVDVVSSDNRRLIYAKVGAALIDYSGSEVIE